MYNPRHGPTGTLVNSINKKIHMIYGFDTNPRPSGTWLRSPPGGDRPAAAAAGSVARPRFARAGPPALHIPLAKKGITHLKKGRVKWHRNSPRCEKVRFESLHFLLQPGQRDDDCWYNWARLRRSSCSRRRLLDRCHCPCQQNWICNRE